MATFNGYTIVPFPASPAPRSITFTATDTVGAVVSPFSGQQQIQNWQASWLTAAVEMPPMRDVTARAFVAFLLACQGVANVFQLGDPIRAQPLGTGAGGPAVNGSGQTGYALQTKGWTPGATGVLLPGDLLQIGFRLYTNLLTLNADGAGHAIASIWPNIRESPTDGTAITLTNTTGIWRLDDNPRSWSINETKVYGLTFKVREAI